MSVPRVSVLITTHARPQLVCRAVLSALAQSLQEIEVIVVLDGPDPATLASPVVGCHFLARSGTVDELWPMRSPRRDELVCEHLFCSSRSIATSSGAPVTT